MAKKANTTGNNPSFVVLHSWMLDLGLKGAELNAYALIYGFSQDGESEFRGSQHYLATWCGVDVRSVRRVVGRLEDKGLIKKNTTCINGVKHCQYSANLSVVQNVLPQDKMSAGDRTKCQGGADKMSYNNIDNNIDNINTPLTPQGEDVLLSLEQDVPAVDADNGFDAFWATYPKCDRKIGRSKCLEIWRKNELHLVKDKVMKALLLDMKTNSWTKDNGAWVPMPQTWLNRKRHVDMDYTSATASSTAKAKWAVYTYDDVRQHSEEWDMWQKNKHTGAKAPAWSIKDADWVKENRDIIISAEKLNG